MPYIPSFAELLGDRETFFSNHFAREPLLRRQGLSGDPAELLSFEDVNDLLMSKAIRPPYLRITKNGERIHENTYTTTVRMQRDYVSNCVVPDRVLTHLKAGATLTWSGLTHYVPAVRRLMQQISADFRAQSEAIAFLSPASGERGFPPHVDPTDVIVIQLAGRKHWKVWPLAADDARRLTATTAAGDDLGEPYLTATLHPGDVLYLPFGCPHVVDAADTLSLHLSLMVPPIRWSELMHQFIDAAMRDVPAAGDLVNPGQGADALNVRLGDVVRAVVRKADGLLANDVMSALLKARVARPDTSLNTLLTMARSGDLSEATNVRLSHGVRVDAEPDETSNKVKVHVGASVYRMPRRLTDRLASLHDGHNMAVGALLPAGTVPDVLAMARQLVEIGVLDVTG